MTFSTDLFKDFLKEADPEYKVRIIRQVPHRPEMVVAAVTKGNAKKGVVAAWRYNDEESEFEPVRTVRVEYVGREAAREHVNKITNELAKKDYHFFVVEPKFRRRKWDEVERRLDDDV